MKHDYHRSYYLALGAIFGYLFFHFLSAEEAGQQNQINKHLPDCLHPYTSIKVKCGKQKHIHLHHWIILLLVLMYMIIFKISTRKADRFIIGFCLSGFFHGLSYSDRFKIIKTDESCI